MEGVRFYFKKGKWHVTSDKKVVNAQIWWTAINQVKCMNHKLRMEKLQYGSTKT